VAYRFRSGWPLSCFSQGGKSDSKVYRNAWVCIDPHREQQFEPCFSMHPLM